VVQPSTWLVTKRIFRSSITLTTTRSTGASVARTAGGAAVDGHAAFIATNPVFGKITRRRHPRYIVAMNATTFRTIRFIVYTAAAYAAIAGGSSIAVQLLDSRQPRHSLCP